MSDIRWPGPLIIGGHSFIPELGNDPALDTAAQAKLVAACLDAGIAAFDTTYEPERVALGRALERLGRSDEATLIAWNFFRDEDGKYLVGPRPFREKDLALLQAQLRTEFIDLLVVHGVNDAAADAEQLRVARDWQARGAVGALGTWAPDDARLKAAPIDNPFAFMVLPCNVAHPHAERFAAAKALGWRTLATSPFNRGYLLDKMVAFAQGRGEADARARVADAMLRFSAHAPDVDHLIVGLRKTEWIGMNLASVAKGPLSASERAWLEELHRAAAD